MHPQLTIGMATYNEFNNVWWTITAMRMIHRSVMSNVEFLVVDNCPESSEGKQTKSYIDNWVPNGKYIPYTESRGTSGPRDHIFAVASGHAVLVIDCHVLIQQYGVRKLIDYFGAYPKSNDLLHGVLLHDDQFRANSDHLAATHMHPEWGVDMMYGRWSVDRRGATPNAPPFEIPMHGLGLFACRRDAWPGFHPALRGFGGEEGSIHEKFRQRGGSVLCLPFLRWVHKFRKPTSPPSFANTMEDRFRNYLIWQYDLGKDPQEIVDRFMSTRSRHGMPVENIRRIELEVAQIFCNKDQPA